MIRWTQSFIKFTYPKARRSRGKCSDSIHSSCCAPRKPSPGFLKVPAFLLYSGPSLRLAGERLGCGFLTCFGIRLSSYSTWCDLGFFPFFLSEPNDEGITKNEFPFVIWKSLEPKTGPGSKQEDRGPPPGALELSSALSTALAHFSVISYPPQNLLTENVGKYSLSTVQWQKHSKSYLQYTSSISRYFKDRKEARKKQSSIIL